MPNWIYSSATFSGTKDVVHKLKKRLENSELQSIGDLKQNFNLLVADRWSLGLDKENHLVVQKND